MRSQGDNSDHPVVEPNPAQPVTVTDVTEGTEVTDATEGTDVTEVTERTTKYTEGTEVCNLCNTEPVLRAVSLTIPRDAGQGLAGLFDLARHLKAIPACASADLDSLQPIVAEWQRRAEPVIGPTAPEDVWWAFGEKWDQVRCPANLNPVDEAFERVRQSDLPAVALRYQNPSVRLLVALCVELQRLAGPKPFYLSCRIAARLLDQEYPTVNRWLRGLWKYDRVLELVSKGSGYMASRYRFPGPGVKPAEVYAVGDGAEPIAL